MDRQQSTPQDSIQVLVRIKPGSQQEAVVYTPNQIKVEKHTFAFDRIFPPSADQEDVYNAVGKKLLINTLEGYNSCVFVYGQTGSGKTYTMMGNNTGLMQRSFNQLFSRLNRLPQSQCIVTCSYYELYNEQIIDLLDTRKQKKNLSVRQDVKRGVFVQHLTEESALNSDKLLECLNVGMKNRHIGQTMMNRESSRSHSIFTVSLAIKSEVDGKKVLKTPKLHFVDLAGSERQKMTNASGDRLKQAGNINKSLTTLGMVINALASDKTKTHIPYRDSKLTTLLKDSLGGNSKTFIVATVSTSILCFQETLSTLNFANRAKMVKVKALINEESLSTNLEQFKQEIRRLKSQIARLKSQKKVGFEHPHATPSPSQSVISKSSSDLDNKFSQLSTKLQDLKTNLNSNNMDNIIELLSKAKNTDNEMKDENSQGMEQQGNELIEYMMSNHDLLKRINSTVNQYKILREQIKNVEFNRRMPLEQIKTPSKFERDQYQQLLDKRQNQIKMLQEKVKTLKQTNIRKQNQNREIRRKLANMEDHKQSKEESIVRLQNDREDLEKRYEQLHLKYEITYEQKLKAEKNLLEFQHRLKQSKQLYLYSQQKYQNQKILRNKLQNTIKDLHKRISTLQHQKKDIIDDFQDKIFNIEQKMIDGQRRQQELKNQLDILNSTVEFDKKKIKQYSDKISQLNINVQELQKCKFQLAETITTLEHDKVCLKNEYQHIVDTLKLKNKELENNINIVSDSLKKVQQQNDSTKKEYEEYKQTSKQWISLLESQLLNERQLAQSLTTQCQELKVSHKQSVLTYDSKIFELTKQLQIIRKEHQIQVKSKILLEQKYKTDQETWSHQHNSLSIENSTLQVQLSTLAQQLQEKDTKIKQQQLHILSTKNIVEEHEQLKKTYKQIIKENYKLKGQHISSNTNSLNQSAKNEELVSKVAYYEEKFRLMSIQYNKVQQISKKLKQKELNLLKKVEFYEQSQKIKKLNSSHSSHDHQTIQNQTTKMLQLQNAELKESLQKITKLYQTKLQNDKKQDYSKRVNLEHLKYQLQQKQDKIRKKLQNAIKNWDHNKQNSSSGMTLEQMFNCWQKIQTESRKKIEGINKSIKRQQKLKIQNGFIIKQNTYLKQRVETLERQINISSICQPRKHIKINQELQQ